MYKGKNMKKIRRKHTATCVCAQASVHTHKKDSASMRAHNSLCIRTSENSAKCAYAHISAYAQVPTHASIKKSRGLALWGFLSPFLKAWRLKSSAI
ncbi:uncharacterized protein DS421_6g174650 [Arachis hypogaea]|nr:uncharacterized protein DS421_6g174650 [Arachis hypogaea]